MRGHLLQEIKQQGMIHAKAAATNVASERTAVDSLVLAHLRASGFDFSASIFVPEAGLTDTALSDADACRVLGASLPAPSQDKCSALTRLLTAAPAPSAPPPPPPDAPAEKLTLEGKLALVDEALGEQQAARGALPVHALEEHMLKYQREADARAVRDAPSVGRARQQAGAGGRGG